MKKIKTVCFFILSLFLYSCTNKELVGKKILRLSFYTQPLTLDPKKSLDYISCQPMFMLYRGLMHYNSKNKLENSLCKSYKISKDKKKYTFYLRDDIYWSDGKKISAIDFEKSWKQSIDPNFPSFTPHLFYPIKNAEKAALGLVSIDEVAIKAQNNTLIVELENPCPYFLFLTSFYSYFPTPSHISGKNTKVFSGPFLLKYWKKNSEMYLEKNPYFYDKDKINLDGIKIYFTPNEETAFSLYENNEIDLITSFISPLTLDILGKIKYRKDVKISQLSGFSFLTFNVDSFPFNNKNIRKAFSYAIERQKIVDNITQLDEKIALRYIPPILDNENRELFKDSNKALAIEFLEKGLKELNIDRNDFKVSLLFRSYNINKKEAEILKQMWEDTLKIKVDLECCEEKTILSKLSKRNYQVGLTRLITHYNDPMNIFERFKYKDLVKNYSNWENEKFIDILNQITKETDDKKRKKLIYQAEDILFEEHPISPIYFFNCAMLYKPNIEGIYINAVGDLLFDETKIIR